MLIYAKVMDSMDWFDPAGDEAATQVQALNYALRLGGRVLLRSAGLKPWYISVFEQFGFSTRRAGARLPGTSIDRYVASSVLQHCVGGDTYIRWQG